MQLRYANVQRDFIFKYHLTIAAEKGLIYILKLVLVAVYYMERNFFNAAINGENDKEKLTYACEYLVPILAYS